MSAPLVPPRIDAPLRIEETDIAWRAYTFCAVPFDAAQNAAPPIERLLL